MDTLSTHIASANAKLSMRFGQSKPPLFALFAQSGASKYSGSLFTPLAIWPLPTAFAALPLALVGLYPPLQSISRTLATLSPTPLLSLSVYIKVAPRITAPSKWLFHHQKRQNPWHRFCTNPSTQSNMQSLCPVFTRISLLEDALHLTLLILTLQLMYFEPNAFMNSIGPMITRTFLRAQVSMTLLAYALPSAQQTLTFLHRHSASNLMTVVHVIFGLLPHMK